MRQRVAGLDAWRQRPSGCSGGDQRRQRAPLPGRWPRLGWMLVAAMLVSHVVLFPLGAQAEARKQRDYVSSTGKHIMFVSLAVPSHIRPLNHMASELIGRGHRVSFAIPEEGRKMVNTGITVVSSGPSAVPPKELKQRFRVMSQESTAFRGILTSFNEVLLPSVMPMFKSLKPSIKQSPPDIMVIDIAALAGVMLAEEYKIPYVLNNPSLLFSPGDSSPLIPAWGSGFGTSMSLTDRCINAVFPRLLSLALIPPFMHLNKIRWELFLRGYRSQHELIRSAPILTDTVFGLEYPRPLPPLVKMVGPLLPAKLPQLSTSVTDWIRSAEPKVVLIHLGSMTYLEPWQVKEMLDGFSNDAFRVLWVMNKSQRQAVPYVPGSFLIEANVPYLAIVSHPEVIAVVSNCQLDAAQEALYFGKPILCLPFYMDQPDVASRVVDVGAGLNVDKASLSSCVLSHKIWTLISNTSYTARAAKVRKLLERAGGTSRAADFIQETLEVGPHHWTVGDADEPWHKRVLLDIMAVYGAVVLLIVLATRSAYTFVVKCWRKIAKRLDLQWPPAALATAKGTGDAVTQNGAGAGVAGQLASGATTQDGSGAAGAANSAPAAAAGPVSTQPAAAAGASPANARAGAGARSSASQPELALAAPAPAAPASPEPAPAPAPTPASEPAVPPASAGTGESGGDASVHPSSDGLTQRPAATKPEPLVD